MEWKVLFNDKVVILSVYVIIICRLCLFVLYLFFLFSDFILM